jgi:hypothetical protein
VGYVALDGVADMTDQTEMLVEQVFDWLVLAAGLVMIVMIAWRSSRPAVKTSPGVMVGVIVWLTVFVFALFLIFAPWDAMGG